MAGNQTHVVIEPHNAADGGYVFKKVRETVDGDREVVHVESTECSVGLWDFTLNSENNDEVYFYVTPCDESTFEHRTFTLTMDQGETEKVFQISDRLLSPNASTVKANGDPTPDGQKWGTDLNPGFQSVVYTGPHHPAPGYCCLGLMAVSGGKKKENGGPQQHKFTVTVSDFDPHDPDIGFEC